MKKKTQKCHICKNKFIYNAIGRHYKYKHLIDLSVEENYFNYFNYNYPNFIEKIINECNKEKKSINVLLKERYSEIGEGTINHLQLLLKNKINVDKKDINKLKTIKREKTCLLKYGSIYSDEFKKSIGGFKNNSKFASRASIIARNNLQTKETRRDYINSDEFKEKRKKTLLNKYGTLIIKQTSTSKWHLKIKKILESHGIRTEHEKNILKFYITDEFDKNKNVCIELNGDFWHCNPKIFEENYYHPIIKMLAKNIWEKDEKKYENYRKNGYDVFIIWESDNILEKINEYKLKYGY